MLIITDIFRAVVGKKAGPAELEHPSNIFLA